MSVQLGKLCSIILEQHFGKNVQIVGNCLYSAIQSRTLGMIVKSTGLKRSEVMHALTILLKFRLAKFKCNELYNVPEYTLIMENVLLILRFPKYVQFINTKFGQLAANLIEELLRCGTEMASKIIVSCTSNNEALSKKLLETRDIFFELIKSHYLIRGAAVVQSGGDESKNSNNNSIAVGSSSNLAIPDLIPKLCISEAVLFLPPRIELEELVKLKGGQQLTTSDHGIFWVINEDKFHTDFRDTIMISAMERKISNSAGECIKSILQLMYTKSDAWHKTSNPMAFIEIKQLIERNSTNNELMQYLDEYISVMVDDQLKFLGKDGDSGGGQYIVQMKSAIEQLTWVCIESVITEKFGSKAARIFRVVRTHKYIEQIRIQKEAMVQSKDAKLITYKLLEDHFLQIKAIRKPGGGGTGNLKSFYLFYVDQPQLVTMLIEMCYKSLFNAMSRVEFNKVENQRLINKSQRIDSIAQSMRERGECDDYIAEVMETVTPPEREILDKVKIRIKNLYNAEIGLDETLFLLQLYDKYKYMK